MPGVYRFSPSWSAGLRYGEAESYNGHAHGDHMHFTAMNDKEAGDAMVAWDSSHFGTVERSYSRQENQSKETDNVFTLQHVMTSGAQEAWCVSEITPNNGNWCCCCILSIMVISPAMALNIFVCEPEWQALIHSHAPEANIYSATTAMQDPHYVQARPSRSR